MSIIIKKEFENLVSENYKSAIHSASCVAENYNVKIFLIGGIVRDLLMNYPIKDIDIVVQGDAIEFCKYLQNNYDFEIISVQENLRTAKVRYKNGVEIDFASTREEKYERSGNLPIAYNFGCELEKDVKRRDFTINTLAVSLTGLEKYSLIDYYNGYEDIINRKIKVLHNKSFIDDPSRIIRALKFMIRFDFNIEENTYNLIQDYLNNVDNTIPLERVKNEFNQYFSIDNPCIYEKAISLNIYKLVSDNIILKFNSDYFNEIKKYNLVNEKNCWFLYFALLIFKSDFAIQRLNLNSDEKKVITDLLNLYNNKIGNDNYSIYKTFNDKSNIAIACYYVITGSNKVITYFEKLRKTEILITGNDLISLGLKPSSLFSEIFEKVLKEKLDGNIRTKEEELNFVQEYINRENR